jgi:hypothetical protein
MAHTIDVEGTKRGTNTRDDTMKTTTKKTGTKAEGYAIRFDHPMAGTLFVAYYGPGSDGMRVRFDRDARNAVTFATEARGHREAESIRDHLASTPDFLTGAPVARPTLTVVAA